MKIGNIVGRRVCILGWLGSGGRLFLFRLDGNEIRLPRLSYKLQVAGINDYNGSYREIGLPRLPIGLCLSSFTTRLDSRHIAFHQWRYSIPDLSIFNSGSHDFETSDIEV